MQITDLQNGKKLNKKQLRSVNGGLMMCIDPKTNGCRIISKGCADPQCRPDLIP
ncbi:hypothetical protein N6B72_20655 [Chryseobacterium soli]|uniref:hypothetical protein n=2 Tax=Chryseobacterium TaxID=59732 RepID=UPI000A9BD08D|nr:hypothetical protein [Chryseobacterium soli]MDV7699337.1 hypothetical protein [Chryseobacterium soli]